MTRYELTGFFFMVGLILLIFNSIMIVLPEPYKISLEFFRALLFYSFAMFGLSYITSE